MVRNVTIYLDNGHLEFMDRVRCGFIVAEHDNGEETFHNDLIDSTEYPTVEGLVDDVVGIFKVDRRSVLLAA